MRLGAITEAPQTPGTTLISHQPLTTEPVRRSGSGIMRLSAGDRTDS
jgi:hypothetical protein